MKILYENKNHSELNVIQHSDTELTGSGIKTTDVGVGFLVGIECAQVVKEIFLDDQLLNQLYIMMQNRQRQDHPAANCNPGLCPICAKNYPDIAKAHQ